MEWLWKEAENGVNVLVVPQKRALSGQSCILGFFSSFSHVASKLASLLISPLTTRPGLAIRETFKIGPFLFLYKS